jgi:quercetin dioxygenase-like cupin family protein
MAAQHVNWDAVPIEQVGEGIRRQMVWGERVMVCRLQIAARTVTPVHSHPHEQITLVEQGPVEFTIGEEMRVAETGDVLHFPANLRHGATMLEQDVVLVDIFSPIREEFLPATTAGKPGDNNRA